MNLIDAVSGGPQMGVPRFQRKIRVLPGPDPGNLMSVVCKERSRRATQALSKSEVVGSEVGRGEVLRYYSW